MLAMRNLHDIFCPTSPFAAGPQGKVLVIKVLLLIEYRNKALTLSEHVVGMTYGACHEPSYLMAGVPGVSLA
jgi:hypothetical protein